MKRRATTTDRRTMKKEGCQDGGGDENGEESDCWRFLSPGFPLLCELEWDHNLTTVLLK